jgi:hypothetical protein
MRLAAILNSTQSRATHMPLNDIEKSLPPNSFGVLLREIKERIRTAHYAALRAVNRELGRMIVERQSGQGN